MRFPQREALTKDQFQARLFEQKRDYDKFIGSRVKGTEGIYECWDWMGIGS